MLRVKNKLENRKWYKFGGFLILLVGIVCIAFPDAVYVMLPFVFGTLLLVEGLIRLIEGIKKRDYAFLEGNDLEQGAIVLAVGIGILIYQDEALFLVGGFWGLWGLMNAAKSLNVGMYHLYHKKPAGIVLLKGIIEAIISFILIFDPVTNMHHHILILGIELIFEGITALFEKKFEKEED